MDEFLVGDFRDVLPTLPDRGYHLVCTSPPYNVGLDYGDYADKMPWDDYWHLLWIFLRESSRLLVPGGRIAVNLPGYAPGKRPGQAHHHVVASPFGRRGSPRLQSGVG